MGDAVLEVEQLTVQYRTRREPITAVDHVSFKIQRGEIMGLAGESGSGKTTVAQAIARLNSGSTIVRGNVWVNGVDWLGADAHTLRELRWKRLSLVTQSVMGALNPLTTIGTQFNDTLEAHGERDRRKMRERGQQLLGLVGLSSDLLRAYPHQLSGGMRQRVGIAMALMFNPDLIIMDEPTTALDVVVERDLLSQIKGLQQRFQFAVLFITHDLSLLFRLADRIAIMYAGQLVEEGPVNRMSQRQAHPYTRGLIRAFPSINANKQMQKGIPGNPPSLTHMPSGCRFFPRCPMAVDACAENDPPWLALPSDPLSGVKCFRWKEVYDE